MSEFDNYDSEDQIEESETRNPVRARMKQLEKETADLRKQVAEAETAKRELAFVKAGLDPLQPMTKYFVKAYDGDLTPDAIRQAAVEAQLISPPRTSHLRMRCKLGSVPTRSPLEAKHLNHQLTGHAG
jgi:hypothetical protein